MKSPYSLFTAQIEKIEKETYDTKTYTISIDTDDDILFDPGQYIMISAFGRGEAPFSLCGWNQKNKTFDTTIRRVGRITNFLYECNEGDMLGVRGPYGRGWPLTEAEGNDVLIIAGGIGIPPLRPVINIVAENRDKFKNLEILYGAKTPDDMIFTYEFERWRRIPDTSLTLTIDKVPEGVIWDHRVGVVPILLDDMQTSLENSIVLICGPEIMMHFVIRGLIVRGFGEDQIYVSLERRMKCGLAHCGHCMIGSKYVCKDGPVFPYIELVGLPDLTL